MTFTRQLARFNKHVTNRIQGIWAPRLAPWAVVVHRGRKSGRTYRTPVLAGISGETIVIGLPYGADADWVRNVMAAAGGSIVRRGRTRSITNVRVVERAELSSLPSRASWIARPLKHALVARIDERSGH
jgi:deazaflavin-dependent oxidoreductase (nitroreductase family)